MPQYHSLGDFPIKRLIVAQSKSWNLLQEELVGTQGFEGLSSFVYHIYSPSRVRQKDVSYSETPKIASENGLDALSFKEFVLALGADYLKSRKKLFVISSLQICIAAHQNSTEYFF